MENFYDIEKLLNQFAKQFENEGSEPLNPDDFSKNKPSFNLDNELLWSDGQSLNLINKNKK